MAVHDESVQLNGVDNVAYGTAEDSSVEGGLTKPLTDVEMQELENKTLCMEKTGGDGKPLKIDFVLVWEERNLPEDASKKAKRYEQTERKWRRNFRKQIEKRLISEEHINQMPGDTTLHFLLLHCPWTTACYFAEDMSLRAPLQAYGNTYENFSEDILAKCCIPNAMVQEVPNMPVDYYTCIFKNSKIDKFIGSDNHDTFFLDTQRSNIVWEVLSTSAFGAKEKAEIGIERLLKEGTYKAAYPLHEGSWEYSKNTESKDLNMRQILRKYWARWGIWYKYQPLDHVRHYFGEKIGLYFTWLGLYTAWLLPASFVGLMVFAIGWINMSDNVKFTQICQPNSTTYLMCPVCNEEIGCPYWQLADTCKYIYISYLFDHAGTVFFAVFISFWAVFFLEHWKRTQATMSHRWDCAEFEDEDQAIRPQYAALAPTYEHNPVTGAWEPHFPERERIPRIVSGVTAIVVMGIIVIVFIIAVILYRVIIMIPLFKSETLRDRAMMLSSGSAAGVNLILIMSLGRVYELLATKLTQWEMHRTETEYEDALIFKVFLFQFVNFYASIIYVGFFKGKFAGYPGNYNTFFGLRQEECANGSCLMELAMQLGVIMIGKQTINNCQEIMVPKLKTFLHRCWKLKKGVKGALKTQKRIETIEIPRWELDYELIENEGLFSEYLEMVLQFGFITIFVAAFPLAPLFALLNNWVEIRLDAAKFVRETRRSVAERAQDIGQWYNILELLARLAVISNAFLIAFTSDFLAKLVYRYTERWDLEGYMEFSLANAPPGSTFLPCRYLGYREPDGSPKTFYYKLLIARLTFVIVFEHFVIFVQRLIDFFIPDVPEDLQMKMKKEKYLAKEALTDVIISPEMGGPPTNSNSVIA